MSSGPQFVCSDFLKSRDCTQSVSLTYSTPIIITFLSHIYYAVLLIHIFKCPRINQPVDVLNFLRGEFEQEDGRKINYRITKHPRIIWNY